MGDFDPDIARVAAPAPATASDPLFVTIRSFDGGRHGNGPCLWEPPAGALPQVGELCVVVRALEEDGEGEQLAVIAFDRDDSAALDSDVAALDTRLDTLEAGAEAMIAPSFQNSWQNYSAGGFLPAGYYRRDGRVFLSGVVNRGASALTLSAMFTLPVGYRPDGVAAMCAAIGSGNAIARVDVSTVGVVSLAAGTLGAGGSGSFVSLEGLSFRHA